jgi:hypothetical protein
LEALDGALSMRQADAQRESLAERPFAKRPISHNGIAASYQKKLFTLQLRSLLHVRWRIAFNRLFKQHGFIRRLGLLVCTCVEEAGT